jgi:hypothetical protein
MKLSDLPRTSLYGPEGFKIEDLLVGVDVRVDGPPIDILPALKGRDSSSNNHAKHD